MLNRHAPGYTLESSRTAPGRTRLAIAIPLYAVLAWLLLPALAHADPVTSLLRFETDASQSMWAPGTSTDINFNEFYGIDWNLDEELALGPVYIGGKTAGKVGVDVGLKIDSGSVNAVVPYRAGLEYSYTDFVDNDYVTINAFADLQTADTLLNTSFPTLQFSADLILQASASIRGGGVLDIPLLPTLRGDTGDIPVFPTIDTRTELLGVNRDGDGEIRLLADLQADVAAAAKFANAVKDTADMVKKIDQGLQTTNPDGTPASKKEKTKVIVKSLLDFSASPAPIVEVDVRLPQINTSGGAAAGTNVLTTGGSDQFLDVDVDLDGVLTMAGLLPPLEYGAGLDFGIIGADLHANILDVTLQSGFSVIQEFALTPTLVMDLEFSRAVTYQRYETNAFSGAVTLGAAITGTSIQGLTAGNDKFELLWQEVDAAPLQILPSYSLQAMLHSKTDLGLDLALNFQALSASADFSIAGYDIGGISLGPLLDETYDLNGLSGAPTVGIFEDTFALGGFKTLSGGVITLDTTAAVFEGANGNGVSWQDAGNWKNGNVGDTGLDVVIEAGDRSVFTTAMLHGGDTFDVGNLTVGANTDVVLQGNSELTQLHGPNTSAVANAGRINAFGDSVLSVVAPVSGGGEIRLFGGSLTTTIEEIPLSNGSSFSQHRTALVLEDQHVVAIGRNSSGSIPFPASDVTTYTSLEVGADSTLGVRDTGILNLNSIRQWRPTLNQGRIYAEGHSTLDWKATEIGTWFAINNDGGLIEASGGSDVRITSDGGVHIGGGTLRTDAGSSINILSDLRLTDARRMTETGLCPAGNPGCADPVYRLAHIDGNVTVAPGKSVTLGDGSNSSFSQPGSTLSLRNDGVLRAGQIGIRQIDATLDLSGTGTLHFGNFLGNLKNTIINGAQHTLSGAGDLGTTNFGSGPGGTTIVNNGTIISDGSLSSFGFPGLDIEFSTMTNNGTLLSTGGQTLSIDHGTMDTSSGKIIARGGDVDVGSKAVVAGGAGAGPGGVWTAENGTIHLENAANQWQSLARRQSSSFPAIPYLDSSLDGGEIVLIGNNSDFVVSYKHPTPNNNFFLHVSLEDGLDRIGAGGKLTLVNRDFDRGSDGFLGIGGRIETINIDSGGVLELANSTLNTGSTIVSLGALEQGTLQVNSGGLVMGHGTIDSNVVNAGSVKATGSGKTLEVTGGVTGGGDFIVENGARLELNLGTCGFLGVACPFSRSASGENELTGNGWIVNGSGSTQATTLQLTGLGDNALVHTLTGTRLELNGANANFVMVAKDPLLFGLLPSDYRVLEQTLQRVQGDVFAPTGNVPSTLRISDGKQFIASNDIAFANGSVLQVDGAATRFSGKSLAIGSGSRIDIAGGTVQADRIDLFNRTTRINGHGVVDAPIITGFLSWIIADGGELDIRGSRIDFSTDDNDYGLIARSRRSGENGPASILRLTDTTVMAPSVKIEAGAMLTGNGTFNQVDAFNSGTIQVATAASGNSVTTFNESTLSNTADSTVSVSGATLRLQSTSVSNEAGASTRVFSANTDAKDSVIELLGSTISGGQIRLISQPDETLVAASAGVAAHRVESAPATRAILEGSGTLTDVELTVGAYSRVDANVSGERLTFEIGTGSVTNLGVMQASQGGILALSGGTVSGSGDVRALNGSVVEIRNMFFNGVGLHTEGDGVIRDLATSTFANLSNSGTFEVAGHVTLAGNVNNENGLIRILDDGVVQLAQIELPDGSAFPFSLTQGRMLIDDLGMVVGNDLPFALRNALLGGSGIVDANVVLGQMSTIDAGSDGMTGMLTIEGDLTMSDDSTLVFDVDRLDNGQFQFDQLLVGGLLDLSGNVFLNFNDDAILDEFTRQFTFFDLLLTSSLLDPPPLGNLRFSARSVGNEFDLFLADDGSFSRSSTPRDPGQSVPEPGTLPLMLLALLALVWGRARRQT